MESWNPYFHQPKPIDELINNALIVVDTNVLLSAYQWREVTVNEMIKTLRGISDEDRLRIPLQVIKEFSSNRPKELIQRINDIETLISGLQPHKPLNQKVPMLEGENVFEEASRLQGEYNEVLKEYRNELTNLRDSIKDLFQKDLYLENLKEIIEKSFYSPGASESMEELKKKAEKRFKEKIPPGYKDDPKESNSFGDYIIWDSILKLKSNVIFISGDKKQDWVYRDTKKNSITARRELVEEFFIESGGKDFAYLSPKEFISLFNPNVTDEIKEDLSTSISKESNYDVLFYYKLADSKYNYHYAFERLIKENKISGYIVTESPIDIQGIEVIMTGLKEDAEEIAAHLYSLSQGNLITDRIIDIN